MIYSQWQPSGGYVYFEIAGKVPINDDQEVPRLKTKSKIGVSSLVAGRAIPAGAEIVGEGDQPVGLMAPVAREGHLSGSDYAERNVVALYSILGVGLIAVAFMWTRGERWSA